MSRKTGRLANLWHELKRRRVLKVVAMYAATAFIILEVVDIVSPALGLPSWTVPLVIVLLVIGFPVTIILSWVFDLTPDGIIKTDPIETQVDTEEEPSAVKRSFGLNNVVIVVLLIIVGILLYPRLFKKDKFQAIREDDGEEDNDQWDGPGRQLQSRADDIHDFKNNKSCGSVHGNNF